MARWSIIVLLTMAAPAWAEREIDLDIDTSLPITLDADSSEFDRRNDRLRFTGLRMSQGTLRIKADEAVASRLDFENSLWVFTGNVVFDSGSAKAYCDEAEMTFKDHELRLAVLRGRPTRFEQTQSANERQTQGRARTMEYDLPGQTIRLIDEAWITDGANEVSGKRITYDLAREYISADAEDSGQIRMKIQPPVQAPPEGQAE